MKRSLTGTSLVLLSLSIGSYSEPALTAVKKAEAGPRIAVTGSLAFRPNEQGPIYLADFPVTLKGGSTPQKVKTDIAGRYRFYDVAPGKYTVCWEQSGWVSGCTSEIEVTAKDSGYGKLAELKAAAPGSVVWGNVVLADGGPAVLIDYSSGTEVVPWVEALDAGGNSMVKARTNADGWYAIGVSGKAVTLRVASGELRQEIKRDPAASASSGATPLKLGNSRPLISTIAVLKGKAVAQSADPGEVLTLRPAVSDPDGDPLRYVWAASAGAISSTAGGVATWKLPDFPATMTAYLLVTDGKGGANTEQFTVVTGEEFTAALAPAGCMPLSLANVPAPSGPTPPFLTFALGGPTNDHAAEYYENVDPQHLRTTLGDWWTVAGFNATNGSGGSDGGGGGEVKAPYLNFNDLGFGRDMHFNVVGEKVYAWVTNYGCPNNSLANANLAFKPVPANAVATVCMEFAPVEGTTNAIVKFFVYAGGQAAGTRQEKADLDKYGLKPVPNLCQTCHGGQSPYFGGTNVNLGSSFIPFDLALLRFPSLTPCTGDFESYHTMNRIIADKTKPSAAIVSLVNGWYTPLSSPPTQNNNYLPTGWKPTATVPASATNLYKRVFVPGCRTCHYSFSSSVNWDSYQSALDHKSTIESFVCGSEFSKPVMPHAAVTYINFWTNAFRFPTLPPKFLGAYTDPNWPVFEGGCTGK